jgi:hypothetical protein
MDAERVGLSGVALRYAREDLVDAAAKELGIETEPDAPLETKLLALRMHFEGVDDRARLVRCVQCGGISDEAFGDACPYCGHDEVEPHKGAPLAPPKPRKPRAPGPVLTLEPKEDAMVNVPTTAVVKNGVSGPAIPPPPESSTPVLLAGARPPTVEDLDAAIAEVQRLRVAGVSVYWRLGRAVARVWDGGLWKQRLGADGKPKYKTWDAFAHAELHTTPAYAKRAMDVAAAFTETEVRQYGHTKLALLLDVPAEMRDEMREKVAQGAGYRELVADVHEIKEQTGYQKPPRRERLTKAKTNTAPAVKAAKEKKSSREGSLTVANIAGTARVKLFAKPANTKAIDWEKGTYEAGGKTHPLKPAKKIGDIPFGRLALDNGVSQFYSVLETAAGHLEIKVVSSRD